MEPIQLTSHGIHVMSTCLVLINFLVLILVKTRHFFVYRVIKVRSIFLLFTISHLIGSQRKLKCVISFYYYYYYYYYLFYLFLSLAQVGIGQLSKTVGTYVDSQWDCAQFVLPSEIPCLCFFTSDTRSIIGESPLSPPLITIIAFNVKNVIFSVVFTLLAIVSLLLDNLIFPFNISTLT